MPIRPALAIALVALTIAIVAWWTVGSRRAPAAKPPQVASARTPSGSGTPDKPSRNPWSDATHTAKSEPQAADQLQQDPLAGVDERAEAWAKVDLEEIRKAMPDNLYWRMAVPTQDPDVLRERDEERARWNVEYGKVLSNTATDEEIDAYYAHQQQISTDYLEFLLHLRDHYADVIPQEDVGALKLAGELHLARLEEIPRRMAEAHERHKAHEEARRAWLEEQKAFETQPSESE